LFPDAQCELISFIVREILKDKSSDREMGVMLATHSPYIVNFLNLLIRRDGSELTKEVALNEQQVEVYEIVDGCAIPLKTLDKRPVIDTRLLSDPIANIYTEFKKY
jgi:hypothetical protein